MSIVRCSILLFVQVTVTRIDIDFPRWRLLSLGMIIATFLTVIILIVSLRYRSWGRRDEVIFDPFLVDILELTFILFIQANLPIDEIGDELNQLAHLLYLDCIGKHRYPQLVD